MYIFYYLTQKYVGVGKLLQYPQVAHNNTQTHVLRYVQYGMQRRMICRHPTFSRRTSQPNKIPPLWFSITFVLQLTKREEIHKIYNMYNANYYLSLLTSAPERCFPHVTNIQKAWNAILLICVETTVLPPAIVSRVSTDSSNKHTSLSLQQIYNIYITFFIILYI